MYLGESQFGFFFCTQPSEEERRFWFLRRVTFILTFIRNPNSTAFAQADHIRHFAVKHKMPLHKYFPQEIRWSDSETMSGQLFPKAVCVYCICGFKNSRSLQAPHCSLQNCPKSCADLLSPDRIIESFKLERTLEIIKSNHIDDIGQCWRSLKIKGHSWKLNHAPKSCVWCQIPALFNLYAKASPNKPHLRPNS